MTAKTLLVLLCVLGLFSNAQADERAPAQKKEAKPEFLVVSKSA